MAKDFEIKGEFTNFMGNICKVVKVTKIKQGRSKSVNQITCEITHGTTSKVGLQFTQTEAIFKKDWKPIKKENNEKT